MAISTIKPHSLSHQPLWRLFHFLS
ncbi:hypothetical protein CCACVL1_14835, partial [Corchorus capsularis]